MQLTRSRREGKRYVNKVPTNVGGLSIMFKVGPRFFLDTASRSPQQPLGPFHTDARVYATVPASGLRITWFGHASSLIEIDGVRILIDPVWDERAAPTTWAGPKRFFAPTLPLEGLPPIDAVLISHDHYDHLGAGTIRSLAKMEAFANTQWITTLGVGGILGGFGIDRSRCKELDWTENASIGPLTITALPARHFSGRSLFNRFETLWASFALVGPKHRVFYGADSGEWIGFCEVGQRFGPFDVAMLEIGAYDPLWADIHMGPEGAVRTFRALGGQGLFMPIHWGLFDLALHPWKQPIETITAIENLKLWSPAPGSPTEVVRGQEVRSDWWR
ncbi:MAG TPA: MBL fold metallo-hydrolase [Terracidiphilus sp.]|jgi:L-ascorbate metabolism protein UlaG (beta-lactamase superfamily)